MTICIAAISNSGKYCCYAVDTMITAQFPIGYEFETKDVRKIYPLNENVYVLTAGDALGASTIIKKLISKHKLEEKQTVKEITELLLEEYQNYRRELIQQIHFFPRGLNIATYYEIQQKLQIGLVNILDNQLANFDLNVSLIILGYDKDGQKSCHLYSINNPGVLICHDEIGFACIGSGAPHATYYLIGEKYKKTMDKAEVKKLVLEAKKKSEVAPGVGQDTTFDFLPTVKNGVDNK